MDLDKLQFSFITIKNNIKHNKSPEGEVELPFLYFRPPDTDPYTSIVVLPI